MYHAKDPFVLCFSYGNYKELARKMLHRPPENYDGCVRFKDAKLLAELIYRTGETELGAVCDLFEKPIAGKVKYAAMRREPGQSRYTPPGPLVKTDKHAAQKEYRIALMPRRSLDVESVSIKIKPPPDLFTLWGEIWHR